MNSISEATAYIKGNSGIYGEVNFYQKDGAVLVEAHITGLPADNATGFFAFHIHEGKSCGGTAFSDTGGHYNPGNQLHPLHAGDLPPLISCGGESYMAVLTDRFSVSEIIGKTVVVHSGPDDFHSQPAGNSGEKIACGVIFSS